MSASNCLSTVALCVLSPLVALAQWEPEVPLTDDPAESVTCFDNARGVAVSGPTVHVVWHDSRDGNTEVYYKHSADDGASWSLDRRLTDDGSWSERPAVAVSGATVHVVWYDGRLGPPRIYYKGSPDDGTTWGPDVCLTPDAGVGYHPSVAVSGAIVHVAWTDMSAGPQIYYTRSLDGGAHWDEARNITPQAPPAGKNLAAVAVAGAVVHVTWMDTRGGPCIYYTRSLDDGQTWELDRPITSVPSQFASVAVAGAIVHVAYADFRFGNETPRVYYTRSLDAGVTWETAVPLAEALSSWYPSIAVAGTRVHVVWPDNRNGDVAEIYYKGSVDDGATWGSDTRLTENASESREPSVAVSGAFVHAIWGDDRDGNWEIYHGRCALGATGIAGAETVAAPRRLTAGPNPSAGQTVVRYQLPVAAPVVLEIFDASGALVRRLRQEFQPSGSQEVPWNGRDDAGRAVPSGVYLTRLETNGAVSFGRVVVTR